jgi:hypothetical protein
MKTAQLFHGIDEATSSEIRCAAAAPMSAGEELAKTRPSALMSDRTVARRTRRTARAPCKPACHDPDRVRQLAGRQAEVGELDAAVLVYQGVGWFQVAAEDALVVRPRKAGAEAAAPGVAAKTRQPRWISHERRRQELSATTCPQRQVFGAIYLAHPALPTIPTMRYRPARSVPGGKRPPLRADRFRRRRDRSREGDSGRAIVTSSGDGV